MDRKVLLHKDEKGVWTFVVEDNEIVEIQVYPIGEQIDEGHQIGDIYIGKVKKIAHNIGAAFIEISPGLECYYDLSHVDKAIFTEKKGKKPIVVGDELLVQISKEASKNKVATVTSDLSFNGFYGILTSGNTRMGVSTKIPKPKREAMKEQLRAFDNDAYGIIVRTNAKDVAFEEVEKEIKQLIVDFEAFVKYAKMRTCFSCLKMAPAAYINNLMNVYAEGLSEIITDDARIYDEVRSFYKANNPGAISKIRYYNDSQLPLSALYNTPKAISRALSERVWLPNGAYLMIQPTEALTVIDVNSGKYISKDKAQDGTLKVNLEAAKEIAKQLRLRNISGIIIIDFINSNHGEDTVTLIKALKGHLAKDPIQTSYVDLTELHLVEVTRKKIRKPLAESLKALSEK